MLHEGRLDGAVSARKLGLGETVRVTTKMGDPVERGRVKAASPRGIMVVSSDGERTAEHFFSEDFYLFHPEPVLEQPVLLREDPRKRNIMDMSPDERVAVKLRMLEQGEEDPEMDASAAEAEPEDPSAGEPPPEGPPDTQVDTDALPADIKRAIITTKEMDPEQVNTLLALVGDAAVKGLNRAGVASTEILGIGQKIQNAAYAVLTRHGLARDTLKEVKKK